MSKHTYESAGVSIKKGDDFARFIGAIKSAAVSPGIGGFAGGIEIDLERYRKPVLLSTTDGVGTKLLVAKALGAVSSLGIDLVAMCVNDLIVCGAKPLVFLDYIATGRIDEQLLQTIILGVVKGCEIAECTLAGGETAEMPDVYGDGDFDLAGFATGIVEKEDQLPKMDLMAAGDPIYAFPSSGVHSNGFSLARRVIPQENTALMEELLVPTRIYVREILKLLSIAPVNGAAHITGGGLEGNFSRILPPHLEAGFTWNWPVPHIFSEIQTRGTIDEEEMRKVFNMGIGIAFTLPKAHEERLVSAARTETLLADIVRIGELNNV